MTQIYLTSSPERERVAEALRQVLADTYALYGKTHGFHWNVTGPTFAALHTMFESQYNELWLSLDDLAERIRALGAKAPQGFGAVGNLSSISGGDPDASATDMVTGLLEGREVVIRAIAVAFQAAEAAGDQVSQGLLTDLQAAHEKQAWMLKATLGV